MKGIFLIQQRDNGSDDGNDNGGIVFVNDSDNDSAKKKRGNTICCQQINICLLLNVVNFNFYFPLFKYFF